LERKSLFPARQKADCSDLPILKILISRQLAFEQNFEKAGFKGYTEKRSDFQNSFKRPNRLENRVRKGYLKQPLKSGVQSARNLNLFNVPLTSFLD